MNLKNLKYEYVKGLLDICKDVTVNNVDHIKQIYEHRYLYFNISLEFLIKLNLINKENGKLSCLNLKDDLPKYIAQEIINNRISYERFWELLDKFSMNNGILTCNLSRNDIVKYSSERHLLQDIGLILIENDQCIIEDMYIMEILNQKKVSLEQLKKINLRKEQVGEFAEKAVLEFEYAQYANYSSFIKKSSIKYISPHNINAGYDIESFCKVAAENGSFERIYIEVKAVNSINNRFYWSKNEIDISKKLGNKYYIYFVSDIPKDLRTNNTPRIQIVQNPYLNIFDNIDWENEYESISFWKGDERNG